MTPSEAASSDRLRATAQPLSSVAIGRMLREHVGVDDLEVVRRCHDLTGGDPFLVDALVDALASGPSPTDLDAVNHLEVTPPPPVVASAAQRLRALTTGARDVAEAAAVAGPLSTLSRLRVLTGRPAAAVRPAVEELVTAGFLRGVTVPVYRAPLVAAAVRHELDGARRQQMHARLARLLNEQGGADLDIAHHLSAAGSIGEPWAGPTLRRAARQTAQAGRQHQAVRWLRSALEEPLTESEQRRVLEALATAELVIGDRAAVGRLRALADRSGAPEARLRLARALLIHASPRAAMAELESLLEETDDPEVRRRIRLQQLTALRFDIGLRPRSRRLARELTDELRTDPHADPAALAELAYEQVLAGTPRDVVLELGHRALRGAQRGELGADQSHVLFLTLLWAGDHAAAQRMVQLREQVGDLRSLQLQRRSVLALHLGFVEDAADLAAASLDDTEDAPMIRPSTAALLARCQTRLGRPDEAAAVLEPVVADRRLASLVTYHPVLLARAEVARALGDWESALTAAQECADFSARMGTENPAVVPWHPVAAEALEALGRTDEAARLAEDALARLKRFGYGPDEVRVPLEVVRDRLRRPTELPTAERVVDVIGEGGVRTAAGVVPLRNDLVDRALRYVAVQERPVLREELVEVLWPDVDPETGRHRLRKLLSRLRQRHGDLVVSHGEQLALAPDVDVDLHRFRRLARAARTGTDREESWRTARAALALATGTVCPLDRYEDWAIALDRELGHERDQVSALLDELSAARRTDPARSPQPPAAPS